MYQENQFRTFNVWKDGDILHIFLTCSSKKYNQFRKTIQYVKRVLGLNFDMDYDGTQIYFTLSDFEEYNEFKEYFYRYLCKFEKEEENKWKSTSITIP